MKLNPDQRAFKAHSVGIKWIYSTVSLLSLRRKMRIRVQIIKWKIHSKWQSQPNPDHLILGIMFFLLPQSCLLTVSTELRSENHSFLGTSADFGALIAFWISKQNLSLDISHIRIPYTMIKCDHLISTLGIKIP